MNSHKLRNLQEAYMEVYNELDEELTGERKKRALEKGGYLANRVASGKEGQPVERRNGSGDITMRTTTKAPTKRGGEESKGERKTDWSGYEADRGSGNKAAKRASKSNESFDLYDLILSHLLDEGYADTQEGAEVIMVNMSEDWRESITEAYKKLPLGKMMRKVQKRATREADTRAEIEYDPTFPTTKALKAAEKASRENKRSDTLINVADTHNEKQAKRKEKNNRIIGSRKRDAERPRSNELQDNW